MGQCSSVFLCLLHIKITSVACEFSIIEVHLKDRIWLVLGRVMHTNCLKMPPRRFYCMQDGKSLSLRGP